ncbi:MAG TPA: class I SAM-dependent methyltransferase [Pyrinomonadaceae bacterium]|nr:class I SAM-dependent methyltransferase [Pyrinomonadaceae bacterium]
MSVPDELKEVLAEGRGVREVGDEIYSALADEGEARAHMYDGRAGLYDAVVGTWAYNRLMWGSTPRAYREFARRALASDGGGLVLDAACGSLLFTAEAYGACGRTVVAFDQSLRMLGRARGRLERVAGRDTDGATNVGPAHVLFLQADALDMPFRPRAFQTVLSMNVLHHLSDAAAFLRALASLLGAGGQLHLTSLISNGRAVGDRYLETLYRAGQLARPRTREELRRLVEENCGAPVSFRTEGNMAFVSCAGSVAGSAA